MSQLTREAIEAHLGVPVLVVQPTPPKPDMPGRVWAVSRAAGDFASDPAVVLINPDDEVTPESFTEWLDRRQVGEPVDPGITAAETLVEIRATGEA